MYVNEDRTAVEIDTASNSTVGDDSDLAKMHNTDKTAKLMDHLRQQHPVTIDGKAPTLNDVRAIVEANSHGANDLWKVSVPKKAVTRSECFHPYAPVSLPFVVYSEVKTRNLQHCSDRFG